MKAWLMNLWRHLVDAGTWRMHYRELQWAMNLQMGMNANLAAEASAARRERDIHRRRLAAMARLVTQLKGDEKEMSPEQAIDYLRKISVQAAVRRDRAAAAETMNHFLSQIPRQA